MGLLFTKEGYIFLTKANQNYKRALNCGRKVKEAEVVFEINYYFYRAHFKIIEVQRPDYETEVSGFKLSLSIFSS